ETCGASYSASYMSDARSRSADKTCEGSTHRLRRRPGDGTRATDDDGAPGPRPRDVGRPDPCGPGRPGRSVVGACAEPDQSGVMLDAWGPLGPCVTSNSTFWFSSSER